MMFNEYSYEELNKMYMDLCDRRASGEAIPMEEINSLWDEMAERRNQLVRFF